MHAAPATSGWSLRACAVLALALAAALVFANRALLDAELHEIADAAANSLLVQDAKSLRLLTGNYSRVGFHHPGPALLYVLAAGEWLFHDALGIVRSPIAGQLIAAAIYNAAWSGLLLWIVARMAQSRLAGLAAVAAFWAVSVAQEPRMLSSLWFPHLYYMPFAVMLAAAARLAGGHADALVALALSFAFLVHGHIAFAAVAGIVVAGSVAAWLLARAGVAPPAPRDLRRQVAGCLVVAALFLLPIVLHTALHFPGEIPGYVGYRSAAHHGWLASIRFLALFWGAGLTPLLAGAVIAALLVLGHRVGANAAVRRAYLGIGWATALATLATLVYARFGIDHLMWTYTAYFYMATPALALAVAGAGLALLLHRAATAFLSVILVAAAGWTAIALPPLAVDTSADAPRLEAALATMPQTVVLDLDGTSEWERVWGTVAGAAAIEARQGVRRFCIDAGWHILFTRRLRCGDDEVRRGHRILVSARPWPEPDAGTMAGGLRLVPHRDVLLQPGRDFATVAANAADVAHVLVHGWSLPEPGLTWSMDREARIAFRVAEPSSLRLAMEMTAFLPRPDSRRELRVSANGRPLATWGFNATRPRATHVVDIPGEAVGPDGRVRLRLEMSSTVSPASLGLSPDIRQLGVALHRLRVEPR